MRKDFLLCGAILIVLGLTVLFIPIQLSPLDLLAKNWWLAIPLLVIGIITIGASRKEPMELAGEKVKEALENFKRPFKNSEYEVDYIIADLRLGFPNVIKGSIQVKMNRRKEKEAKEANF
ncbi:MAG: hypothetical protein QXI91_06685 [Candidatus Bathyarchaeia archaeon]